jgi:TRAP transporter TAXI family solute receptor
MTGKSMIRTKVGMISLAVVVFAAISGQASWGLDPSKYPKQMVLRAGAVGGPWIPMCTMIADLMMKKFPGLQILVQPGGGLANIRVIEKGVDSKIGFAHCPLYWEAKEGKLDKGNDYKNISAVLSATASTQQFAVRANSDIKSFSDLKNKRVACGKKGSGGEITCKRVLEAYGVTYDEIRKDGGTVSFVDSAEQGMGLKDGVYDFVDLSGNYPHSVLQDVETATPIRLLSIDKPHLEKIIEKYPFYAVAEVSPGGFKGQKEPVTTLLNVATLIVNNSLSPEFVYEITKLIIEKGPEIHKAMPFVDRLTPPSNALAGLKPNLMNPAAVKYFKEIGVLK